MYTRAELMDAIDQIADGKHSIQNCERLAAIYTVLDHLYKEPDTGYSYDNKVEAEAIIGEYGKSDFLKRITGKPAKEVWYLVNELVDALSVLNPKLLNNFLDKLNAL